MKKFVSLILSLVLIASMAACAAPAPAPSADPAPAQSAPPAAPASSEAPPAEAPQEEAVGMAIEDIDWPQFLTILGASQGGNSLLGATAVAQLVSNHTPSTANAQVTNGGNQNVYLMEQGEGYIGCGSGFACWEANNGEGAFADDPVETPFAQVANYSRSYMQVAVAKNSGITSIEELRGKKVVVGATGSATEGIVRRLMGICGLYSDANGYDFQAEYSGVQEGLDLISNGQADATIIGGTIPFTSFIEMFISDKIELIPFTQAQVDAIVAAGGGYSAAIIPAGSYDGKVTTDLLTVVSAGGLVCRLDAPEDIIYGIVKLMCENWEELGTYHDMFTQVTQEQMAQADEQYAPLHPGAKKYYIEAGYITE